MLTDKEISKQAELDAYNNAEVLSRDESLLHKGAFERGALWARDKCNEWISVEYELPTEYKSVMIWEKGSEVPCIAFRVENKYYADKDHYEIDGTYPSGVVDDNIVSSCVTHWKPLPEPPKQ
jgi:hypothetical protein